MRPATGVAALYLDKREGKELVYMGKVGTGWSRTVSSQISASPHVIPADADISERWKPKHFWAFAVWNYADHAIQVLEVTQATIRGTRPERIALLNSHFAKTA